MNYVAGGGSVERLKSKKEEAFRRSIQGYSRISLQARPRASTYSEIYQNPIAPQEGWREKQNLPRFRFHRMLRQRF